jgi:alginate O-acetyltransferase complex protein AlgI
MMGFHFKENFNYPYTASSITDCWRRWHISLGSFFRDYVYIPLGGNRKGKARTYFNILIVWLLTGLWHGASWNFVLWGLFFCIFLVIEKLFLLKVFKKIPSLFSHIYTLLVVFFGWILFRFSDFRFIPVVLKGMFGANGNALLDFETKTTLIGNVNFILIALIAVTPLMKLVCNKLRPNKERRFLHVMFTLCETVIPIALLLLSTLALVGDKYNPFLYFQF